MPPPRSRPPRSFPAGHRTSPSTRLLMVPGRGLHDAGQLRTAPNPDGRECARTASFSGAAASDCVARRWCPFFRWGSEARRWGAYDPTGSRGRSSLSRGEHAGLRLDACPSGRAHTVPRPHRCRPGSSRRWSSSRLRAARPARRSRPALDESGGEFPHRVSSCASRTPPRAGSPRATTCRSCRRSSSSRGARAVPDQGRPGTAAIGRTSSSC